jgi:hypothetical protein
MGLQHMANTIKCGAQRVWTNRCGEQLRASCPHLLIRMME